MGESQGTQRFTYIDVKNNNKTSVMSKKKKEEGRGQKTRVTLSCSVRTPRTPQGSPKQDKVQCHIGILKFPNE